VIEFFKTIQQGWSNLIISMWRGADTSTVESAMLIFGYGGLIPLFVVLLLYYKIVKKSYLTQEVTLAFLGLWVVGWMLATLPAMGNQECKKFTTMITTEAGETVSQATICRYQTVVGGEFGEWKDVMKR